MEGSYHKLDKREQCLKTVEILPFIQEPHVCKVVLGACDDKINLGQVNLVHCSFVSSSAK